MGHRIGVFQFTGRVDEVPACGNGPIAQFDQSRRQLPILGLEFRFQVPIFGLIETHADAFALHHQACRHRLYTPRGEFWFDLPPQDRGNLVSIESIENSARFLRIDQTLIDFPGGLDGCFDGGAGDLVEDHPAHGNLWFEYFGQMPGNGLPFAVFVAGEEEGVSVFQQFTQFRHLRLLAGRDHIEGGEVVVDVYAQTCPWLVADGGWNLSSTGRKITNVTDRGFHDVALTEVSFDGSGFRR